MVKVIKSRQLRWEGHVTRVKEGSSFKITGKHTGRRFLERPKRRWEDHIRIDLKEIAVHVRNWVDGMRNVKM
jgi:hypothetical protein